jgi:cytochrome c oxidase cbb3-type subunit III
MTNDNEIINNDQYQYNEKYDKNITDHEYDGIKELNNPAPAWIMAIFYITILFSLIYGAHYFWFGQGNNQDKEYMAMNDEYNQRFKQNNESSNELTQLTDDASLAEGGDIFKKMNCFACHGINGEGGIVGPNLTDNFWIHGCSFTDVFNTIKNGYPAKGMTPYKSQLNDEMIQKVASFVLLKLKGSNPPNAKASHGDECK